MCPKKVAHNMDSFDEENVLDKVHRVLKGDAKAFEPIVRLYQKRIYFTVLQIAADHEDTNDILQDTFIKAYTKLYSYDESYPFYPWLYRIAVNTALNHKKKKTNLRAMSIDEFDGYHPNGDLVEAPKQLNDAVNSELVGKLKKALACIPDQQRVVFVLRVNDGLSYQEISETLEISIGTVMSRLSRAREKLRKLLKSYVEANDTRLIQS